MRHKIKVFLLGTNASVFSCLRRHRQEYLVLRPEGEETSLSIVGEQQPHLVVLVRDDLRLCQQARTRWPTIPLVMVSANTKVQHVARALDLGADDYITLPVGEDEFLARLRALVRRMPTSDSKASHAQVLRSSEGNLVLNLAKHECVICGHKVRLTATEFELLRVLMEHQEQMLSHRFLLQHVWGSEYGDERDYLRVYISQLRRKIEPDPSHPQYILTEPGVGYVFGKHSS